MFCAHPKCSLSPGLITILRHCTQAYIINRKLEMKYKKVLTFLAFLFRFTLRPSRNKSLTILLKDNLNVTSFYIIKIKVAIIKFVFDRNSPTDRKSPASR